MGLLPIPFIDHIPRAYTREANAAITQMCDLADDHIEAWFEDAKNIPHLLDVERCPARFLNRLGNLLNAGIINSDSETMKRRKIYAAIRTHKIRGSWENDAKNRIMAVISYTPVIIRSYDTDDWILCGDGFVDSDDNYWATLGDDGEDDSLGMYLTGDGEEIVETGNIYIDLHEGVHTEVLTAAQVAEIVEQLASDVVPAYLKIHLGYIDGSGAFIHYDTIY
jgi:hypothetical protein